MKIPNSWNLFKGGSWSPIDQLIQLVLDQAKARGLPPEAVQQITYMCRDLARTHREFRERLHQPADPENTARIERLFESAVVAGYWLGSESPDPMFVIPQKSRTAKATKVRTQGWEEPLERALKEIVWANPYAANKVIILQVRAEMDKQRVTIPEKDGFLLKRIRPHREVAQDDYRERQRDKRSGTT